MPKKKKTIQNKNTNVNIVNVNIDTKKKKKQRKSKNLVKKVEFNQDNDMRPRISQFITQSNPFLDMEMRSIKQNIKLLQDATNLKYDNLLQMSQNEVNRINQELNNITTPVLEKQLDENNNGTVSMKEYNTKLRTPIKAKPINSQKNYIVKIQNSNGNDLNGYMQDIQNNNMNPFTKRVFKPNSKMKSDLMEAINERRETLANLNLNEYATSRENDDNDIM